MLRRVIRPLLISSLFGGALALAACGPPPNSNGDDGNGDGNGDSDGGNNNGDGGSNLPADCADGTELVYVVDDSNNFLSFDPRTSPPSFKKIGTLDCNPAAPLVADGSATAQPFSMSVDRDGRAWVLYSSGEIMWVDVETAACTKSPFVVGTEGFELFGMGFVADAAGSDSEKLYIAGGKASAAGVGAGTFGSLKPSDMSVTKMGAVPTSEYSPELTGTGGGDWWAYFPGSSSYIAKVDKSTGTVDTAGKVAGPSTGSTLNPVTGWAFAHWGGKFYVFVTTGLINETSNVWEVDPTGGAPEKVVSASMYKIVGAGVSTCAPIIVD